MGGFRRWFWLVAIGLLLTLIIGCGQAASLAGSGAPLSRAAGVKVRPSAVSTANKSRVPSKSSAVPPSSSTASGTTAVNPANFPGCVSSALSAALVSRAVGAGTHLRVYAFRNIGKSVCTLVGYPRVELLNAQGQPLATNEVQVTIGQPDLVVLSPGGQAWFVMQYPDGPSINSDACPASADIAITTPNGGSPLVLAGRAGTIRAFGSTSAPGVCGQLAVQPVTPPGVPLHP